VKLLDFADALMFTALSNSLILRSNYPKFRNKTYTSVISLNTLHAAQGKRKRLENGETAKEKKMLPTELCIC
jgi:hypothetical protein